MRATTRLLVPGLAKRSLDEAKRFAKLAFSQEGVRAPSGPYSLIDFSDPDTIPQCKTMSDADLGGFSSANLSHVPKTNKDPVHARFFGSISTDLPRNNPQVQRTGYAGWRNKDRPYTIFGRSLWDLDPYIYLALRVKSDGRKYLVNIQTESIVYEDLHQHRLHTRSPGEWETVFIAIHAFVRTNHGEVVEPQSEMMRQKVRTIGMSLTDRVPGPFDLSISRIWASVGMNDDQMLPEKQPV
ncbi:MAG: hypothetical protein Q9217_003980 [Psora testacea]